MKKIDATAMIAKRGLKTGKLKNSFIIFTIALAVCLMMVIALYFIGTAQRRNDDLEKRYQATFLDVNQEKIDILKQMDEIESVGVSKAIEDIKVSNYELNMIYIDSVQLELNQYKELKGTLPQKENEVVVLDDYLTYTNQSLNISDEVLLGDRAFKISGILQEKGSGSGFMVIVSKAYAQKYQEDGDGYSAYFKVKNAQDMTQDELKAQINDLGSKQGYTPMDIVYSSYYFGLKSMEEDSHIGIVIGVYIVILLACGLVIYSIFYVSVIGKANEYGRLRTIGADKKQIRKIVRKEARLLSAIGIPVGLLAGVGLGFSMMPDAFDAVKTAVLGIVVAAVVFIIIKISTAKPAKLAAGVPPIVALKQTGYSGGKEKKISSKLRRKISPVSLAVMNMTRNQKKTLLTIFSLGLCGILLMACSTYLESIDPEEMAKATEFPYGEFKIGYAEGIDSYNKSEMYILQGKDFFQKGFMDEILALDGVDGVKANYGAIADITLFSQVTEPHLIEGITEAEFEKMKSYMEAGDVTYQGLVDGNGIIVSMRDWKDVYGWTPAVGENISVTDYEGEQIEFEIVALVSGDYVNGGLDNFFLPKSKIEKMGSDIENHIYQIAVKGDEQKRQQIGQQIQELIQQDVELELYTLSQSADKYRQSMKNQTTPIYILVLFIGIFGVINLINTLITSIISRKRELSVLQTLGLGNRQLQRMLLFEGGVYFIGIAVLTLSVGTLLGFLLCQVFDNIGTFGQVIYQFPIYQLSIYLVVVFVVLLLFSLGAIKYYQKETLVERMRTID